MESKNLVICDPETKFASAFAQYLTRQKELAVRVRTCSDLSYVLAIQEKEKIDFLFISSEYPEDSRKQVKAGMVFVIAPEREVALENREVPIYKYQPGDQILAEMIRQCSMSGDEKQIFLKITGKKNCRVIAVYSPVRRIERQPMQSGLEENWQRRQMYCIWEWKLTVEKVDIFRKEHRHWQMSCTMQGRNRAISERYLQLL